MYIVHCTFALSSPDRWSKVCGTKVTYNIMFQFKRNGVMSISENIRGLVYHRILFRHSESERLGYEWSWHVTSGKTTDNIYNIRLYHIFINWTDNQHWRVYYYFINISIWLCIWIDNIWSDNYKQKTRAYDWQLQFGTNHKLSLLKDDCLIHYLNCPQSVY